MYTKNDQNPKISTQRVICKSNVALIYKIYNVFNILITAII
jgi:hypothetical protein